MTKLAKVEKAREPVSAEPRRSHALTAFDEMDRLFDQLFADYGVRSWLAPLRAFPALGEIAEPLPHVDVIDRDEDLVVRAELPGVDKKDLEVTIADQMLTIRGTTRHEEEQEEGDYHRREIRHGEFSRTLALPAEVDESKAKAVFKDGVLELTAPKTERTTRRTIEVE